MDALVSLLIIVIVAGLVYWIVSLMPLPQPFKQIAMVLCALILLLWVLGLFFGWAPSLRVR